MHGEYGIQCSSMYTLCSSGTVYFQQTEPFLILSGFCVYSVASALFMFPALWGYYLRTLQIYTFEHADGAGRASDLVIQPFVRFISMAIFPVVICAGVLYVLVSNIGHICFGINFDYINISYRWLTTPAGISGYFYRLWW